MGKHDRLSRDQKRKAKLKKRAERSRKHEALAYTGKTYKTDEYAPIFYRTEVGIYEAYVMCDRVLTDDEVEAAIERLVTLMRQGPLPPLAETGSVTLTEGGRGRTRHRQHPPQLADQGGGGDTARPRRPDRGPAYDPPFDRGLALPEPARAGLSPLRGGVPEEAGRLGPANDAGSRADPRAGGGPTARAGPRLGRGGEQDGGGGVRRSSRVIAPRGRRRPCD